MKKILLALLVLMTALPMSAQRVMDKLDRGLIAQKTTSGVFVSWRILGEEYYDVTYNIYRNGEKLNATPLNVSNYSDPSGNLNSVYTVSAVVRGQEQPQSKAANVWNAGYLEIVPQHDSSLKSTYVPNDACCCDVDGDGELEILMKYDNQSEISQSFPKNGPKINGVDTHEHTLLECLKLDGTVLWWVNCGPNMGDFQNNEINIVGYDWDGDGKSEVIFRAADGTTIHKADGTVYTVGNANLNYRGATGGGANWFMHDGNEYLLYVNGETGNPYQCVTYPLLRLEPGEYDLNAAWGDGYGHRSSKYFFGAPYLDGKKPSIFLARGIYTRHKMIAYDVNPDNHQLVERWKWYNNTNGVWKGQGYHNYGIADVDMDGRDEIVYGSMVIDDNGFGLSTTGLGHGDAQHCGDFDPFRHGLEIYACNEDQPGNNYRDATTSKIYHRYNAGSDDGRAMAGNFTNGYVGALGCSAREGAVSLVSDNAIPGMNATGVNTNFRIYWDGDLLEETFNYRNGKNTEGVVAKYGAWDPIYICQGSLTNNDTKGTPCYQGDVFGDWREEIIMRTATNNIRIYSTPTPTQYRNYTLWHDHQYRNAMVWQMCGYNQPPHVSYFLGNIEGITMAPPPLTLNGREAVADGGKVDASLNGKHVVFHENKNSTLSIENGAAPYILTINVPTWVQGTAPSEATNKNARINYETYKCDVTGGAITGEARLVKQGDGILNLPKVDMTHTGNTDVWGGTVNFDGTMRNSNVWLNRFAQLNSNGGEFKSLKADYAAVVRPGGENTIGNITVDSLLTLNFGSRFVIDIDGAEQVCDKVIAKKLSVIKKTGDVWTLYGPQYIQPVIEVNGTNLVAGDYVIAECEEMSGSVTSIKIEGVEGFRTALKYEDGKLILTLGGTRGADMVIWTGANNGVWDFANTQNVVLANDESGTPEVFVNGDFIEFNDNASNFNITLNQELSVDTMLFVNTKAYTIQGSGSIVGGALIKEGTGALTINTMNSYTGGNYLRGGTVIVTALANDISATGNLGGVVTAGTKFSMEGGAVLQTSGNVTNGSPIRFVGDEGGVINNAGNFVQQKAFVGTLLTKRGAGTLTTSVSGNNLNRLVISAGTVVNNNGNAAKVVELQGGTINDNVGTSNEINVKKGKSGTFNSQNRQTYKNKITGAGSLTVTSSAEKGSNYYATRTPLQLNLSEFGGTIVPKAYYTADGRFTLDTSQGSDSCTFNIGEGVFVQNSGRAFRIGTVTGKGSLAGTCTFSNNGGSVGTNTWNVGNEKNFTFAGTVIDNAHFNKMGDGTMTVSGKWTTTGKVTVKNGTMKISNLVTLGTGALEVAEGATLQGSSANTKDPLTNSSVTVNGTLFPGASETSAMGSFSFGNKNVTIGETGKIRMGVRRASTGETVMSGAYVADINKLTLNGKIEIFFVGYEPQVGDELRIMSNVTSVAGTPDVVSEDGSVEFDTSRLATEGVVVVKSIALSIDRIPADETVHATAYSISGQKVASFDTTVSALGHNLSQQTIPAGTYVIRIESAEGTVTVKRRK